MKANKLLEFCDKILKASNTDQDSCSQVWFVKQRTDFLSILYVNLNL